MKKLLSIIICVLFLSGTSFSEVLDLTCKLGDRKFYVGLDFKNSKWLNENGSGTYMTYTKDVIGTVKRQTGKMDVTHTLWLLSRKTGVGELKGYILTEEELQLIDQKQLDDIFKKGIGDLSNKSLAPARNKSFATTFVDYLVNSEKPHITSEFECEKSDTKYTF